MPTDIPGSNGLLQVDENGRVTSRGVEVSKRDDGAYRVELYTPTGGTEIQWLKPADVLRLVGKKPAIRNLNNATPTEAPETAPVASEARDDSEATEAAQDAADATGEPENEPDEASVSTVPPTEGETEELTPLREKGYRLSKQEVAEIKWLLANGATVEELDARYPCSDNSIKRIASGETYADVAPQKPEDA